MPGTFVGENLPLCARVADKFTILRSHSHADNGHKTGYHYVLTGYKASLPDGDTIPIPNNILYPSIGSIMARELGARGSCPPYINVPDPMTAGGPGFYGAEFAPFVIESDPVAPDFEIKDLAPPPGSVASRIVSRQRLLDAIEQGKSRAGRAGVMSTFYEKASDLVNSAAARRAFDLAAEPEPVRARYGHTSLGQCSLLARRLIEAGCRFVGVDHGSWDTHFDCFPSQEKDLFPHADRAFSALISDLDERELLDSTLVVMMGEMGRTPRINGRAGRDHWSQAQSVLLAGGGIKSRSCHRGHRQSGGVSRNVPRGRGRPVADNHASDGDRQHQDLLHPAGTSGPHSQRRKRGHGPVDLNCENVMRFAWLVSVGLLAEFLSAVPSAAQKPPDPEVAYVFPPGAQRGQTVTVHLAGFDWTPDLAFFVLDPHVQLQTHGSLSRHLMPEPPFPVGIRALSATRNSAREFGPPHAAGRPPDRTHPLAGGECQRNQQHRRVRCQ